MTEHHLAAGPARATIRAKGAELVALSLGGAPVLWTGDPAHWGRHAPILFPFIGRLPDGGLQGPGDTRIVLPQHGFARDRSFTWVERAEDHCTLELEADAETRAAYPFDFRLTVSHRLHPGGLETRVTVSNPGPAALPFTFGFHPGFLRAPGARVVLPQPVEATLLTGGLLDPSRTRALPAGIDVTDELFADDALIVRDVPFDHVRYESPGLPPLVVRWDECDTLALWTKPGAPFLCIEPWAGTPCPVGTTSRDNHPTLRTLNQGRTATFGLAINGY